jgi:transposase-like protein
VKFRKGRKFSGVAKNVKTGEIKNFKDALVYEINHGIRFIELSAVGDPACKSCLIQGVYDSDGLAKAASCNCGSSVVGQGRSFMSKVASIENSLMMYGNTDLYKQASQEELQQIDQVLQTLEQISVNLIQNRKRVEVEFASDLVKILSELQEFADELTGAGYGQLDGTAGAAGGADGLGGLGGADAGLAGIDSTIPAPAEGVPSASGATGMPASNPLGGDLGITPVAEPLGDLGDIGSVSGSPSKSMFKFPTAPKKPIASSMDRLVRVAELLTEIKTALTENNDQTNGDEDMNRRIPTTASKERASIKQALSENIKGNANILENVKYHGNNAKLSGGIYMDSIIQTAARQDAPAVLPEKQLNSRRTDVEQDSTQQVQLEGKRTGKEPQTLQENQIDSLRTDVEPSVLQEKQLAGLRKNDEPTSTQQVQLESNRTGKEQQSTTEVQLDNKSVGLWERSAMQRKNIKTAGLHAKAVIRVLAESAIRCSATPQQIREAASTLVDGLKVRASTLDLITSASDVAQGSTSGIIARARYWGGKGITIASATKADMSTDIVAGLRTLVAMDAEISPEAVMDVLDVVSEDDSVRTIADEVDAVMAEPQEETQVAASVSMKKQIRQAMMGEQIKQVDGPKAYQPSDLPGGMGKKTREQEREEMKAVIASKTPTHVIEASLQEIGTTLHEIKNNKQAAKQKIIAFVNNISNMKDLTVDKAVNGSDGKLTVVASKVKNLRVANITNVTVDGTDGTIQIAIQTDEGDTTADVSIPLDDQGADVEGAPLEGDATGEGLDGLIGGGDIGAPDAAAGTAPVAPPPNAPLPTAASTKKTVVTAQMGGGGGGMPGGGALGGAQDPGSAVPQGMPAMDSGGLQTFTQEADETEEDKAPGVGEQMMPGSICPFCHGSDTTTGKKDLPAGAFECNNCGAVYEVHVNIEVLNPEGMSFEEGDSEGGITEPKLPEMPIAASIKLDKNSLQKIASSEQKYGHVCPACGMTECKVQEKTASGNVIYVCPSCQTKTTKEILVASDKSAFLNVQWDLNPKKVFTAGCPTCKQAAIEYVALMKVTQMMQKAAQANAKPETAFPEANCAEYISRRFGANAVATFGPCKGKPLSACVCKQLKSFGLRKRYDVEKLASVYTQPDPMEKCLELQKAKGYKEKQASTICDAMKTKYAKEADENEWLQAFAGDSRFTTEELRIMKQKSSAMFNRKAQMDGMDKTEEPNFDLDISAPLDDVQPVGEDFTDTPDDNENETVMVEIPESLAKDLAGQIETQIEEETAPEADSVEIEVSDEIPEQLSEDGNLSSDMPIAASGDFKIKVASAPKKVEDISSGVSGKLKGGNCTIGKEQPFSAQKPTIPSRGDASKIKGEKETIPNASLPDIAQGNSFIGDEASTQKGMPSNSVEMRGRVVANTQAMTKEAKTPTKVEDISSGVEGKVKGGTGTIGNEEAFDAKKPNIPEGGAKAKIGGEKDTIPEATLPDIPADNALIGGEAETMKGTPGTNLDFRGRVLADTKRDQQLAKITAARYKKACIVAAKLLGLGRIAESELDNVIEDLSKIEVDRIDAFAERLTGTVKTASVASPRLATAIVQEASVYSPALPKSMADGLKGIFTIGSPELNQRVKEDDRRDEGL